ncbi:hypothetical protein ACLB2K_052630 [Fragaria x ananassa]
MTTRVNAVANRWMAESPTGGGSGFRRSRRDPATGPSVDLDSGLDVIGGCQKGKKTGLASGSRTRPLKLEKPELVDLDSTRIDLGEVLRGGRPARSGPSSVDNCSGGSGPPPCQAIDTEDLGFVHGVV